MTGRCENLKAVVFDWAGTTIDHGSRAQPLVVQKLFGQIGVDITLAQAREPMGMEQREHIAAIGAMESVAGDWLEKFSQPLCDRDVDSMYAEYSPTQKTIVMDHCKIIAGVPEAIEECRQMGLRIGSATGYARGLMELVSREAADQGYRPDCVVCAEDVPRGRPAPFLLHEAAKLLDVYPMWSMVKVDDTPIGIEAGRNAGCWTVGVTRTGNCVGLSQQEVNALPKEERRQICDDAGLRLIRAGAHYTVESVASIPTILRVIEVRAASGEMPF